MDNKLPLLLEAAKASLIALQVAKVAEKAELASKEDLLFLYDYAHMGEKAFYTLQEALRLYVSDDDLIEFAKDNKRK